MRRPSAALHVLVLAAWLAPSRATAQAVPPPQAPPPSPAATTPGVRLVPGEIAPMYQHSPSKSPAAAPYPSSSVDVGAQAVRAYAAAAARVLGGPDGARAELQVRIALVDADLAFEPDGWVANVEHDVVLADVSGELGRWRIRGEWAVEGPPLGESAVPRAFERAAEIAAGRWEAEVSRSPHVGAWLAARGIAPPAPVAAPTVPARSKDLVRPGSRRARSVAYVDGGVALSWAQDPVLRSSGGLSPGGTVRVGVSGPIAMADVLLAQLGSGMGDVLAIGADVGAVLRVRNAFELRGGGGLYYGGGLAPSAFAGVHVSGIRAPGGGLFRLGVEVRRWIGTDQRDAPPGDTVSVLFGWEKPIRSD